MIGLTQEKSIELGLLCGGSLNSLNGLDSRDALTNNLTYKDYPRPLAGVLAQYNFTNLFSIKSKLLYHIKAGGTTETLLNENQNVLTDFHYVTLPVLAQFNLSKNRWGFFCNTGFYLGSLIKAESVYRESKDHYKEEQPLKNFNKLDFGLILGYGVSFQISDRIRIFVESSLDYGITNASKVELVNKDIMLTKATTGALGLTYSIWNSKNKKKIFNGTGVLDCPDYNESSETKKKTKWRLILYKDGEKIGRKSKKGKSKLFKKKN